MPEGRRPFEFGIWLRVEPQDYDPDDATLRSMIASSLANRNEVVRIECDHRDGTTEVWEADPVDA